MTRDEKHRLGTGLLFIGPWLIGFLFLTAYPLLSIVYHSLCDWSVLMPATFIGTANYRDLFVDELFWKALSNTLFFAALSIPLGLFISLFLAILLNFNIPGRGFFRTVFLPALADADDLPGGALAMAAQRQRRSDQRWTASDPPRDQRRDGRAPRRSKLARGRALRQARARFHGPVGGRSIGGHLPRGFTGRATGRCTRRRRSTGRVSGRRPCTSRCR